MVFTVSINTYLNAAAEWAWLPLALPVFSGPVEYVAQCFRITEETLQVFGREWNPLAYAVRRGRFAHALVVAMVLYTIASYAFYPLVFFFLGWNALLAILSVRIASFVAELIVLLGIKIISGMEMRARPGGELSAFVINPLFYATLLVVALLVKKASS